MKKLFLGLALSIPALAAVAADLPSRVAPPPAVPVFASFDAFASMAVGYNWGRMDFSSSKADGLELQARGSFFAPLNAHFGAQVDGQFERSVYSSGVGSDFKKTTGELAGHAFWRDSKTGLVGVIAQASSTETSFGFLSDRRYFLGAEGQSFFGNFTLYGQAAYENVNFGVPMASGVGADGFVGAAQLRYFVTPNLMIAAKGGYENIRTQNDAYAGLHHSAWLAGGKVEHRLSASPLSLFAEADYRSGQFNIGDLKEHETRAVVGVKVNFGSNTLIERDRSGASLDPIRSLKAIVPYVLN